MQVRMTRIYKGQIYSPTVGDMAPNPHLTAIAIRSAITFAIYGILVLLVAWPTLLTYLSLVWAVRAVVDGFLGWFGAGVNGVSVGMLTEKGRKHYILGELVGVASRLILFGVFAYFVGF
jgi:hypothetical protein